MNGPEYFVGVPSETPEEEPSIIADQSGDAIVIPDDELEISFARSSGPGGQKVNKTETKAVVRWCIGTSRALTDDQRVRLREKLANRMNAEEDAIVVASQRERSQSRNRTLAIERLRELVREALTKAPERKPTKVPRRAREQRLDEKRLQSRKKEERRGFRGGEE